MSNATLVRLRRELAGLERVAVAVSGGVDSMTLAVVAGRVLGVGAAMFHARSAAVPADATQRVVRYAERESWALTVLDAGEFQDRDYVRNPVDRCLYCKRNLYAAIAPYTDAVVVSGTNRDDLGDYRPGLTAARERGVRHPYVDAGIDKAGVRSIARSLALHDLSELPAAPCLSSRIETGIAIRPEVLERVDRVESWLQSELTPKTVRCRVRADAVVVELDPKTLDALGPPDRKLVCDRVAALFGEEAAPVELEPYRMGSAFLREDP